MPRQINKPVSVTLVMDDYYHTLRPSSFTWRGGRYRVVQVQDMWTMAGMWWEQEPETTVWRVICHDGGMYELGVVAKEWKLLSVWD